MQAVVTTVPAWRRGFAEVPEQQLSAAVGRFRVVTEQRSAGFPPGAPRLFIGLDRPDRPVELDDLKVGEACHPDGADAPQTGDRRRDGPTMQAELLRELADGTALSTSERRRDPSHRPQ